MINILIVDDNASLRLLYSDLLESYGYKTTLATNGEDALTKLRETSTLPNLIILDLEMPVKDGFSFRKEQMVNPNLKEIPVIITSGNPDVEFITKSLSLMHYIQKPASIELFISTVEQVLYS